MGVQRGPRIITRIMTGSQWPKDVDDQVIHILTNFHLLELSGNEIAGLKFPTECLCVHFALLFYPINFPLLILIYFENMLLGTELLYLYIELFLLLLCEDFLYPFLMFKTHFVFY